MRCGEFFIRGERCVIRGRRAARRSSHASDVLELRSHLKDGGTLVERDEHLVFTRDAEFSSPRAAAAVVHGGGANGLTAWKNQGGKTLKSLEA